MKCSTCGEPAKFLGERTAPGQPEAKRYFCDAKACFPKETGWTLYPVEVRK